MRFNANDYRLAAEQHLGELYHLHEGRSYVLSHYVAGLAVECIFRAYRLRIDSSFESRHDLGVLFRSSGYSEHVPDTMRHEIGRALSVVATRWSNDHRYRSRESLIRYLKAEKLDRGIRKDILKESSRLILEAADTLVKLGVLRWQLDKKNR